MRSLTRKQREDLLVKLLNDRRGVELAKSLLQRNGDNSISKSPPSPNHFLRQPPLQTTPDWCRCGKCRQMDNPVESVCCINTTCVTTSDLFYDICLNRHVLSVGIINRSDFLVKIQNLLQQITENMHTASTSYTNTDTWEGLIKRSSLHA